MVSMKILSCCSIFLCLEECFKVFYLQFSLVFVKGTFSN
uniref:Uncharacterized protein n=1 Tax=Rhizophora mucronata TaxID=61149 RepID=A0A2P2NUD1_RHIMU